MKDAKGFSLIELMIVVAIVGILAAVAIPQYSKYVVRGNRAAAQAFLMDIASREKQYLLDARSYTDSLTTLAVVAPTDVAKNYDVTVCVNTDTAACSTPSSPPYFLITATPKAGSAQANANDGNLTLDHAGAKKWGAASNW